VWDASRVGRDGRGGVAAEWNVSAAIPRVVLLRALVPPAASV